MMIPDPQGRAHEMLSRGAWTQEHGFGCFEVNGVDGLDLLHRLSTNDLFSGTVPRAVQTVFTTEKGRVVDLGEVVITQQRTLLVVHAAAMENIRTWIERFTILEDVELTPVTADLVLTWFIGPQYEYSIDSYGGLSASNVTEDHNGLFWRRPLGRIPGILLLAQRTVAGSIVEAARNTGTKELQGDGFELLRIMTGTPCFPRELSTSVNPLEVGLRDVISFTKGCYVGQEVVSRLDAYEKVQRELIVLHLQGQPSRREDPLHVISQDRIVGGITSLSQPLPDGTTMALAVCRSEPIRTGKPLGVRCEAGGTEIPARRFLWSDPPPRGRS